MLEKMSKTEPVTKRRSCVGDAVKYKKKAKATSDDLWVLVARCFVQANCRDEAPSH